MQSVRHRFSGDVPFLTLQIPHNATSGALKYYVSMCSKILGPAPMHQHSQAKWRPLLLSFTDIILDEYLYQVLNSHVAHASRLILCVCACLRAFVHACVRTCVRAFVSASVFVYMPVCVHVSIILVYLTRQP